MNRRLRVIAALSLAVGLAGAAVPASVLAFSPYAPSISAAFVPSSTSPGTAVALVFTITSQIVPNVVGPNGAPAGYLTAVSFSDSLPAGLAVATPPSVTGVCGGAVTATAGSSLISLTGGVIAAASPCTISVNVVGSIPGYYTTTTSEVTATQLGPVTGNTATANLIVGPLPPTIAEVFGSASILVGGTTSLTFTVTNPNTAPSQQFQAQDAVLPASQSLSLTGVGFTDTLPAGLVVATPSGLTGSCGGGTITAVAGSSTVTLAGATLAATASCTFALNVLAVTAGSKSNGTGPVTSTEAGAGDPGSAGLTVGAPAATQTPTVTQAPTSTTSGGSGPDSPLLPIMLLLATVAGMGTFLTLRRVREVRR